MPGPVPLVAGVDSSTQSCKVVVCDADTGAIVRVGGAPHPDGTEVDPNEWWSAFERAADDAGGLADVAAISVAAQQHGMVCLDADGESVRPALLWNDTRSAGAAAELVSELGPEAWADAIGSVPVASFTIAKLRWLAEHEPDSLARTEAVCLPHDWLTWRLLGSRDVRRLVTDRGDASGSGWWSPIDGRCREDLLDLATRRSLVVPEVCSPNATAGAAAVVAPGALVGIGTGDNMGAALGLGARTGDVIVSLGTSGVAAAVADVPSRDPSGIVAGFADATGRFLPLACTLNAARTLDTVAAFLAVGHDQLDALALAAQAGAGGLTLLPYLAGERTPNLPDATGSLMGIGLDNLSPANVARAAVEGTLCGLRVGIDALEGQGASVDRVLLIAGASRSAAVRRIAPTVFEREVVVPVAAEYVALGAARQAAWILRGEPPTWTIEEEERHGAAADDAGVYERHRELSAWYANLL
jgi:xylulokinase